MCAFGGVQLARVSLGLVIVRGMMAVCALQPGGVRARCRSRRLDTDWRVYVRGYDV